MRKFYDCIIIGSGIAGLSCAIYLKSSGYDVVVITKCDDINETNTKYAQGGIIGWKKGDSSKKLAEDMISAGCNFNNISAVKEFANEGPKLVFDFLIDTIGVEFSKDNEGEIDYTGEAAHSERRVLHYKDLSGEIIQNALYKYCKSINVPFLKSKTAIDLITNNHHSKDKQELYKKREVMGIYCLDNITKEVHTLLSSKVILATGGIGNIYQHTTNPVSSTGDGLSIAYRASADIINAEFVQFHPTALFHRDIKRFLISESLRGEGAKLVDHDGKQFMQNYSPLQDLAPRDIVSRAIYDMMNKNGVEYMFLNLYSFYKGSKPIEERFSKIYKTCLEGNIDITKELIPIVPAAHYHCGGIKVNIKGKTSLKNLYAIGEVSCTGIHGANRLASSSLLEGLLWAKKTAEDIKNSFKKINKNRFNLIPDWEFPKHSEEFDQLLIDQDWQAIKLTMWNYAGIKRSKKGLKRAKSDLNYYSHRIIEFYKEAKLNRNIIELRNAIGTAEIIVASALRNHNSIGCHYIKDKE